MNRLARLTATVDRFCQFIATLPVSALADEAWGPKEVLAHLVYHHELYISLVDAVVAGTPVAPLTGRFRDLNARAVAASGGLGTAELASRFLAANRRLVALYEQSDPHTIRVEIKTGASKGAHPG
jgi:hypothetical protein